MTQKLPYKIYFIFGFIKSGKSTICRYLADQNDFEYFSSDTIAKQLLKSNDMLDVVNFFQTHNLLHKNSQIQIKQLQKIIFTDHILREQINELIWPHVHAFILKKVQKKISASTSEKIILIETIDPFGLYHTLIEHNIANRKIFLIRVQRDLQKIKTVYMDTMPVYLQKHKIWMSFLNYQNELFQKVNLITQQRIIWFNNDKHWIKNLKTIIMI